MDELRKTYQKIIDFTGGGRYCPAVPEFILKENIPHPSKRMDQVRFVQTQSSLLSLDIFDGDFLSLGVFECDVTLRTVARNQFHHGEDDE